LKIKQILNTINFRLYKHLKKKIEDELIKTDGALSQCKINLMEISNTNKLFSWYGKYFGDVKRKAELTDEQKKEYLQGLIDKIYVTY
jgi:hypothetical protein